MLKNTNSNRSGFTLVELLIVIVVIAILAVISIVAYNGVQNRSKTSAAAAAAATVRKKAEAANAITGSYPQTITTSGTVPANDFESQADSSLKGSGITFGTPSATASPSTIGYTPCTTTGAKITYWDYANGLQTKTVGTLGACGAALTSGAL